MNDRLSPYEHLGLSCLSLFWFLFHLINPNQHPCYRERGRNQTGNEIQQLGEWPINITNMKRFDGGCCSFVEWLFPENIFFQNGTAILIQHQLVSCRSEERLEGQACR